MGLLDEAMAQGYDPSLIEPPPQAQGYVGPGPGDPTGAVSASQGFDPTFDPSKSKFFQDAHYAGIANHGLPPGAVADSRSAMGFYIPDPADRQRYSDFLGNSAAAVSGQNYMDAFRRDRLKNTMEIMKAAHGLDPDLQALVMERLGLKTPSAATPGDSTEGATPTNAMSGGGPAGFVGSKLRQALQQLQLKHQLDAPDKLLGRQIQMQNADDKSTMNQGVLEVRQQLADMQGEIIKTRRIEAINKMAANLENMTMPQAQKAQIMQGLASLYDQATQEVSGNSAPASTTTTNKPDAMYSAVTSGPTGGVANTLMPGEKGYVPGKTTAPPSAPTNYSPGRQPSNISMGSNWRKVAR